MKTFKVRSKMPFKTTANHYVIREPGIEVDLPEADYLEVQDKVELVEKAPKAPTKNKAILEGDKTKGD